MTDPYEAVTHAQRVEQLLESLIAAVQENTQVLREFQESSNSVVDYYRH
jgi:hypothetical protein